jgi:peptidoglycan/LPS O-acetylase OafA/YrhL
VPGVDRVGALPLVVTAGTILASAAVAALSWNLYEQPFLRLKRFFPMNGSQKRIRASTGSEALGGLSVELGPSPAERTRTPS